MRRQNRGEIPSEIGWLVDELDGFDDRLEKLESPSGTQYAGTTSDVARAVAYLASLVTRAASGAAPLATGTVPNTAVITWFATSPDTIVAALPAPTNKFLVTASVGEASLQVGGSFTEGFVSYSVRDVNGVLIPNHGLGQNSGRFYTNVRAGLSISTGPQLVTVDPIANPGPYTIRLFVGFWVAAANTVACSATFNDPSLVVQVIGDGVPA